LKEHGKITSLGTTRDDAAGEAFDKTARILDLGYPGGPAISQAASEFRKLGIANCKLNLLPRPLLNNTSLDFSFSGLKTAVLKEVKNGKYDKYG
jgi:N6-L-threonylcarbamoyladenine synthase